MSGKNSRLAWTTAMLLGAAVIGWSVSGGAAGLDMGGESGNGPIEVLADNGIEWQQGQQRFIARGNAVASRNGVSVYADELIAYYRSGGDAAPAAPATASGADAPMGAGSDITRIEANGAVRIVSATETASGSQATYNVDSGKMVLTNAHGPVTLVTPKETITARDALEYDVRTQIAVARGKAQMVQGTRTLNAEVLTAHMTQTNGKTELETVDATGGVVITTDKETARGSQGKYNAKTGIATLTGSVTLTRGDSVLNGGVATVNMKTGISTLTGGGAEGGKARAIIAPNKIPAAQ